MARSNGKKPEAVAAKPVCLCGGSCGQKPERRGLGKNCYRTACREVRLGKVTWQELEDAGLALAAKPAKERKNNRRSSIGQRIDKLLAARTR